MKQEMPQHPGVRLRKILEMADIPHKKFAKQIGMYASHFSNLLNGTRHVSAALAIKLEKVSEIPATNWMTWQGTYDLAVARKNKRVRRRIK